MRLILLSSLACAWCCCVLMVRFHAAGDLSFRFMIWNLFLAGIPLGLSLLMPCIRSAKIAVMVVPVWLLFFPNAPYVLTDLMHLRERSNAPFWLDLLMLLSFGLVSLWMGFQSLRLMQDWVSQRYGGIASWCFACGTLILTGFGIYLGRFLRWNSWDIVTRPWRLMADIGDRVIYPLEHLRTWGFTLGFGGLLVLGYLLWVSSQTDEARATARR